VKLTYHGQYGEVVTAGNPGLGEGVVLSAGEPTEVPDELAHRLLAEYPGVYSTGDEPQQGAPKAAWQSFRESQGHDVSGLTKDELINLPDTPAVTEEA
jgi:hypothetical protein